MKMTPSELDRSPDDQKRLRRLRINRGVRKHRNELSETLYGWWDSLEPDDDAMTPLIELVGRMIARAYEDAVVDCSVEGKWRDNKIARSPYRMEEEPK
ncbi:MAG: hypothetical protein M0R66_02215 [Candidatus Omnitrophica bacterium]|nr:hypothetical protein [Candidatus Omnitrophota bacterium]